MKIYFKQKYYKMWKTMEVGDCANVCFQTAKRLVADGVASYEEVKKVIKTKKKKVKENGN